MGINRLYAAVVIGSMCVVGCNKSDNKPVTPPSTPAAPQATTPAGATPAMTTPATPAAPTTPSSATIPPPPATGAAEAPAATQAATAADADAQKMLDQAVNYIKENKLDLADTTLTKLEGMKASLSPTLQSGVEKARTMLDAAKAGGGVKLPSLGK